MEDEMNTHALQDLTTQAPTAPGQIVLTATLKDGGSLMLVTHGLTKKQAICAIEGACQAVDGDPEPMPPRGLWSAMFCK
jgi:hypothetical protein